MSSRTTLARRTAASRSNRFASVSRAVTANAGGLGRQAAVLLAASGLVFTGSMAANAASAPAQNNAAPAAAPERQPGQAPLSADASVKISFERPAVKSTPAPVVEAPVAEARRRRNPRCSPGTCCRSGCCTCCRSGTEDRTGSEDHRPGRSGPRQGSCSRSSSRQRERLDALGRLRPAGHHPGLHRHGGEGPGRCRHPGRRHRPRAVPELRNRRLHARSPATWWSSPATWASTPATARSSAAA